MRIAYFGVSPASVLMRGFALLIALSLLMPLTVSAADPIHIKTKVNYVSWKDEYRMDHTGLPENSFYWFRAVFVSQTDVEYVVDYGYYTGIMWLTCNGTYTFQFVDENENVLAESDPIITTKIKDPTCLSYPDGGASDDFNADYSENAGGGYDLSWDADPGVTEYEIWQDGELIGTTTDPNFTLDNPGAVSIVGKDAEGNIVGHSDLQVPTYDGQDGWGDGPGGKNDCDICEQIKNVLQCPGWGDFLNSWTNAIAAAIPPPPDWDIVSNTFANTFVQAFDDWLGDMPAVPTTDDLFNDINHPLPNIDTGFDAAENLIPQVPNEFNNPIDFDITTGDEIEIVDESSPIDIFEPLHNVDYDDPGQMVFPGDPRNHSGGIDAPATIITDLPIPNDYDPGDPIPPAFMPMPGYIGGGPAIPGRAGDPTGPKPTKEGTN